MVRVYADVDLDEVLERLSDEDLLEEVECRNLETPATKEANKIEDCIKRLRDDFINWHQFGMSNENFEKTMKQFFKETIGEYIV